MLPKAIIEKVMEGGATTVADTFDNATLYFSAVDGFIEVSRHCRYVNVLIHFSSLTFLFGFWIKYILESIEIKSFRFSALQLVKFLNKLYNTMDKRMDKHDVYKVETISDQYLVVSGVPKKNGDKYVFLNIVLPFVFLMIHFNNMLYHVWQSICIFVGMLQRFATWHWTWKLLVGVL